MPLLSHYRCTKCDFMLPSGAGGHMYIEDDRGKRHVCAHPAEFTTIAHVLGDDAPPALVEQRTGFNSECLCLECLAQFPLDLDKDGRQCPRCAAATVKSANELVGHTCPKCRQGSISAEGYAVS